MSAKQKMMINAHSSFTSSSSSHCCAKLALGVTMIMNDWNLTMKTKATSAIETSSNGEHDDDDKILSSHIAQQHKQQQKLQEQQTLLTMKHENKDTASNKGSVNLVTFFHWKRLFLRIIVFLKHKTISYFFPLHRHSDDNSEKRS